jgi:hypothetical protein
VDQGRGAKGQRTGDDGATRRAGVIVLHDVSSLSSLVLGLIAAGQRSLGSALPAEETLTRRLARESRRYSAACSRKPAGLCALRSSSA